MWGRETDAPATFYELIARDKEIVKVVLLLTGSIEGAKQGVLDYTLTFDKFAFLWRQDLATEYAAFIATNPNLEVPSCIERCAKSVGLFCLPLAERN